jgi:6,7-dimethyl-8-ribityllumazine synthase
MATELRKTSNTEEVNIPEQSKHKFKIGIAVSEWNDEITSYLKSGAIKTLKKHGFTDDDIIVKYVPGSFELPLGAKYLIDYANVNAVVCLGCVIEGKTRHFEFVCQGVTQGVMDLNIKTGIPVAFGVLTTKNQQQAKERAGGRLGNKGDEAAEAALKMLGFKTNLIDEKNNL